MAKCHIKINVYHKTHYNCSPEDCLWGLQFVHKFWEYLTKAGWLRRHKAEKPR